MTALEKVLALAGNGWAVFPVDHPDLPHCAGIGRHHNRETCTDRGKHPCVKWSEQATTDPKVIAAWFTGSPRNVGIACGPSGLLVVDEDIPGDFERFAKSIEETIPETLTMKTGRGSHFYFDSTGLDLDNAEHELKDYGVNIRGRGGYVVGPGSQHANGDLYTVARDGAAVRVPGWLADALTGPIGQQGSLSDPAEVRPSGLDAVPAVIRDGQRHNELVAYAGSLVARHLPWTEAQALFEVAWRRCEQPSDARLSWAEALATLHDCAQRYGDHSNGGGPISEDSIGTEIYPFVAGGSFILDTSPDPEPLWGLGSEVLLADGEALIIAGTQGLGKTTIGQQLALGRCGFDEYATLLGFPVRPGDRRTLYLAMDRPRQVARSFRRMVGDAWRAELDERLIVWQGPPPGDLAKHYGLLLDLCRKADADTVIVDSLKDAAIGLTDDEVGAGYNRARQTAITEGVQVVELHHNRKNQQGTKSTPGIDDVYGSTWLTSGVGSVILLTGAPGDVIVGLRHLKQPADEVGPLRIIHDHSTGRSEVWHAADLLQIARQPVSAVDVARVMFETEKPTPNEREKARRRLDRAVRDGLLDVARQSDPGSNSATLWVAR